MSDKNDLGFFKILLDPSLLTEISFPSNFEDNHDNYSSN